MFKAGQVRNKGPWKNIDDLEIAVAEYIDFFNHRRLHGEIGPVPPAELEDRFNRDKTARLPSRRHPRISTEPAESHPVRATYAARPSLSAWGDAPVGA